MTTARDNHNKASNFARCAAAAVFVFVLGLGYGISPHVEGAIGLPNAEDAMESQYLPSECLADGLAFSDCVIDF
jgi:hypothetical protein